MINTTNETYICQNCFWNNKITKYCIIKKCLANKIYCNKYKYEK